MDHQRRTSPFWNRAAVAAAVKNAATAKEALATLGYGPKPNHYIRLKAACERYRLRYPVRPAAKATQPQHGRVSKIRNEALLREALSQPRATANSVLRHLGVAPAGRNYDSLIRACHDFGLTPPDRGVAGRSKTPAEDRFPAREVFVAVVKSNPSRAAILRALNRHVTEIDWLNQAAEFHQIELPRGARGRRQSQPLELLLVEDSTYSTRALRDRLISDGVLPHVCSQCGIGPVWNGETLVIQLDHINGVSNDHRLENLRLLCPNCHSQTTTFTGRNTSRRVRLAAA